MSRGSNISSNNNVLIVPHLKSSQFWKDIKDSCMKTSRSWWTSLTMLKNLCNGNRINLNVDWIFVYSFSASLLCTGKFHSILITFTLFLLFEGIFPERGLHCSQAKPEESLQTGWAGGWRERKPHQGSENRWYTQKKYRFSIFVHLL